MELKDQTIHFTYGSFRSHGEMTIVLFQFLLGEGRGMGKVKKLLKIIRTVECINPSMDIIMGQVQQFIEQFNEEFTETKKHTSNMVISLESKVRLAEKMLDADRQNRNRVKRFAGKGKVNPAWEKLNDIVKQRDEEWKSLKKDLAANKRILDKLDKDKAFLQEVSSLLG